MVITFSQGRAAVMRRWAIGAIAPTLDLQAAKYNGSASQGLPDSAFDRETIYGN
ncbi:MAG: hypothetical protein ACFCVB_02465 [Nodosilinea sp.]